MSKPILNLVGVRVGRLVVLEFNGRDRHNKPVWKCRCDCGNEKVIANQSLTEARTKSCGCIKITHGLTRGVKNKIPAEYSAWCGAKRRCSDPRDNQYFNYGGRGIEMCSRWLTSYANFASDMGPKPTPKHTLERKDTNGNYEPSNCKWATPLEQGRNRRNNVLISCAGMTKCIAEWEVFLSLRRHALRCKPKERVTEMVRALMERKMP